jgi:hypothetical protein
MANFTRRSVLRGSLGLAAAGTLARPYIANAAARRLRCGGTGAWIDPLGLCAAVSTKPGRQLRGTWSGLIPLLREQARLNVVGCH